jgi:hypothetical protein
MAVSAGVRDAGGMKRRLAVLVVALVYDARVSRYRLPG